MSFSINSFDKAVKITCALFIWLSGCAPTNGPAISEIHDSPAFERKLLIAVLPFSNLSGTPVPLQDLRKSLISSFKKKGLNLLDDETLERFLIKHRIRYLGGINRVTARDLKWETGADAVLITSVELYSEAFPPKMALTSRLVSTGNSLEILWIDGVGLAGDDSIGPLELSLIEDPRILENKAVRQLSASLLRYLLGEIYWRDSQREIIKFWPKMFYLSPTFESGMKYTVAVVPFLNLSERKFAGEVMALQFIRQMKRYKSFVLLEPGLVRQALLQMRIIMDDGISLIDADSIFSKLHVDLILTGKVFDYQDHLGTTGTPKVEFSALLIGKKSREVVWSCRSYNEGDHGVFFFDWGKVNTAHRMASEMTASAVETIFE